MLPWNILFIALVAIPLLTGGLWLHRPGLHLEYTQPAAAALALSAWLWWRQRKSLSIASPLLDFGGRIWAAWRAQLILFPIRTLSFAWGLNSLFWFFTSFLRHRALQSGMADLGIFTNAIWNVHSMGQPFSSIKFELSLLADHQIYLLYPLGWIFPLWPSPHFLLLLQALILSSGGVALFYLARQRVGSDHPLLPWLPIAYWMAGPIRAAARFDFHPEVFLLPLFLFAIYFLQEKTWQRRGLGFLFFALALLAKESAGPVAFGLGLAWFLGGGIPSTQSFTKKLGLGAMAAGLAAFSFNSRVPELFGTHYSYADLYFPLGSTPFLLALSPLLHPIAFFTRLITISRIKFFLGTLLPFSFLPALAPLSLLAALPGYLILFLAAGELRVSLGFHYAIEPLVGVLFALPAALQSRFVIERGRALLPVFFLATLFSYGRSEPYYWRLYSPSPHQAWLRDEALPRIPRERSVSASYALVPHLAARRWVREIGPFTAEDMPVECLVWDPAVNNTPMSSKEILDFPRLAEQHGYSVEFQCGSFQLYKNQRGPSCLSAPLPCPQGQ